MRRRVCHSFSHILDGVTMVRGTVITGEGKYDLTTYSCCVNAQTGTYLL